MEGGDIDKNETLLLIESIGYEIESGDICTFKDSRDKIEYVDYSENYDGEYIYYVLENISKDVSIDLLRENNKNYEMTMILKPDTLPDVKEEKPNIYKNFNLLFDEINLMREKHTLPILMDIDKKNIINFAKRFVHERYGIRLSHCEYVFTFKRIKKTDNIIKETFLKCIEHLEEHFSRLRQKEISLALAVYEEDFGFYDFIDYGKIIKYSSEKNYNFQYGEINKLTYLSSYTFDKAKWIPQMTIGVKIENVDKMFGYLFKSHNYSLMIKNMRTENKIIIESFKKYLEERDVPINNEIINKIDGYLFLINYNTNIVLNLLKIGSYHFRETNKYPLMVRHSLSTLTTYMNKKYEIYMNYFGQYINVLNSEKISRDRSFIKIYKKYYFVEELIEKLDKEKDEYFRTEYRDKISNTINLIKCLDILNDNFKEKTYSGGNNLIEAMLNHDYQINDDIILIEDRFFIKDLTKIYNSNIKSTLDELKKYIS